jgi:hypothetical protein
MSYQTPEQIAALQLEPLGFVNCNKTILPYAFRDKDKEFFAMADFYHPELDLYVEIKHSHLNGKTSRRTADAAYARIEPWRLQKYSTHCQIQTQWNHSATKHAIVQSTIGAAQYVVVFTKEPDDETMKRILKLGIHAYSLDWLVKKLKLQLFTKKCNHG